MLKIVVEVENWKRVGYAVDDGRDFLIGAVRVIEGCTRDRSSAWSGFGCSSEHSSAYQAALHTVANMLSLSAQIP